MTYKSVAECNTYNQVNSDETVEKLIKLYGNAVSELPQVVNGQVSKDTAQKWLEAVARLVPPAFVPSLIIRSKGFTADEMGALFRFENGEYNPQIHASEVYSAKNLLSVNLTGIQVAGTGLEVDQAFILGNQIVKQETQRHMGSFIDEKLRQTITNNSPKDLPWGIVNPPIIGTNGDHHTIINTKLNYHASSNPHSTEGDKIRMNYQAAILKQHGITTDPLLHLAILTKDKNLLKEQYQTLKAIGMYNKDGVGRLLDNNDYNISSLQVEYDPKLGKDLLDVGRSHWNNIANKGIEPDFSSKKELTIPASIVQQYNNVAEQIFIVGMMKTELATEDYNLRQQLRDMSKRYHINGDIEGLSKLVKVIEHGELEYEKLDAELKAKNVPISAYYEKQYDLPNLVNAAKVSSLNPSDYIKYDKIDKNKILTTAEQRGVDVSQYQSPTFRVNVSGQSRGPIQEIKEAVQDNARHMLTDVIQDISNTPELKSNAVYGIDPRRKNPNDVEVKVQAKANHVKPVQEKPTSPQKSSSQNMSR